MDKNSNVKEMYVVMSNLSLSDATKLIIIAQSGVETAMGTKGKAASVFNFWNLSAGSWKGKVFDGPDTEPDGKGGWKSITQHWRSYNSIREAINDYLDFLSMPRYTESKKNLMNGDIVGFANSLYKDGYYTWPVDDFTDAKGKHSGYLSMLKGQIGLAKTILNIK